MKDPLVDRRPALDSFWASLVACHDDVDALLNVIAQRVVDVFGDGCVLTTVTDDGTALHPRIVLHRDRAVASAMHQVLATRDSRIGEGLAGTVAEQRRSIALNDLDPEVVSETSPEPFLPFVRDHPMRALAIAPMIAAGELVGTLGAVRTESDEPYQPGDVHLLEAFAERAALAIAAARAGPRELGPSDLEAVFDHSMDGVLIATPDGHVLAANPEACRVLGRSERELVLGGRDAIVVADDPAFERGLQARAEHGRARGRMALQRGDGTTFVAEVASVLYTTLDHKVRAIVDFRDVTEELAVREAARARAESLELRASRDPLTGVGNRYGFTLAAEQALAAAERRGEGVALLFLDIDHLKAINDEHGHLTGDAALVTVARAIEGAIRGEDVAGRFGGDEFVVLLTESPPDTGAAVIQRIEDGIARDESVGPMVSISVGVAAPRPDERSTLSELIERADRDMYRRRVVRRARDG